MKFNLKKHLTILSRGQILWNYGRFWYVTKNIYENGRLIENHLVKKSDRMIFDQLSSLDTGVKP